MVGACRSDCIWGFPCGRSAQITFLSWGCPCGWKVRINFYLGVFLWPERADLILSGGSPCGRSAQITFYLGVFVWPERADQIVSGGSPVDRVRRSFVYLGVAPVAGKCRSNFIRGSPSGGCPCGWKVQIKVYPGAPLWPECADHILSGGPPVAGACRSDCIWPCGRSVQI